MLTSVKTIKYIIKKRNQQFHELQQKFLKLQYVCQTISLNSKSTKKATLLISRPTALCVRQNVLFLRATVSVETRFTCSPQFFLLSRIRTTIIIKAKNWSNVRDRAGKWYTYMSYTYYLNSCHLIAYILYVLSSGDESVIGVRRGDEKKNWASSKTSFLTRALTRIFLSTMDASRRWRH